MTPQTYLDFAAVQIFWIAVSVFWVLRRKDELPLITSVLLFYIFSFRLWAMLQGIVVATNISNFGFDNPTVGSMLEVDGLAVLGETVFLLAYFFAQTKKLITPKAELPPEAMRSIRLRVLLLAGVCLPLAVLARASVAAQAAAGKSLAFEITSYLSLFPLALVGLAILIGALWRIGAFNNFFNWTAACVFLLGIAYVTFQPALRFQFLGWVVAVTVIVASGQSIGRKAGFLMFGFAAAVAAFAVAGALRNEEDPDAELEHTAWERFVFAQDANMLDGFALLRQVYPNLLNYTYGGEHLEILERPIPRAWWPGKPVGGYMNKLGIIDADTGFTLGISPSLFGSFYQEGAVYGLILLSAIYGYAFGRIVKFSTKVEPFAGLVIRGCVCAGLIPLLRGGDLPGIYAWFGMSFWPVALIFWLHRRQLFVRRRQMLPAPASSAPRVRVETNPTPLFVGQR